MGKSAAPDRYGLSAGSQYDSGRCIRLSFICKYSEKGLDGSLVIFVILAQCIRAAARHLHKYGLSAGPWFDPAGTPSPPIHIDFS